jgi:hypothetical protein
MFITFRFCRDWEFRAMTLQAQWTVKRHKNRNLFHINYIAIPPCCTLTVFHSSMNNLDLSTTIAYLYFYSAFKNYHFRQGCWSRRLRNIQDINTVCNVINFNITCNLAWSLLQTSTWQQSQLVTECGVQSPLVLGQTFLCQVQTNLQIANMYAEPVLFIKFHLLFKLQCSWN